MFVGDGWEIDLPARWTHKVGRNVREIHFESEDGSKGLYVTVYDVKAGITAEQVVSEICGAQKKAFSQMQGHDWEVVQLKSANDGFNHTLLFDSLEKSKRYRICSKIISNGVAAVSATFHDYFCDSYSTSCRTSSPLLKSLHITAENAKRASANDVEVTRAVAYLKAIDKSGAQGVDLNEPDRLVAERFSEDAIVCYLVDTGAHYSYVQNRHLAGQNITARQLHETGIKNLAELAKTKGMRVEPYGRIFAVLMGGDFEASLVLVDTLWDGVFRKYVRGDYAVAIPARDILAFCDVSDSQAIDELYGLIGRISTTGDHLLANSIYVRQGGAWRSRKQ